MRGGKRSEDAVARETFTRERRAELRFGSALCGRMVGEREGGSTAWLGEGKELNLDVLDAVTWVEIGCRFGVAQDEGAAPGVRISVEA